MPTIQIKGMSCEHCVASVRKRLLQIDGISDVQVDLQKNEARYTEAKPVQLDIIKEAIREIGYEVID